MKTIIFIVTCAALYLAVQINPQPNPYIQSANATQAQTASAQATTTPPYCVDRQQYCDALKAAGFNDDQTHTMIAIGMAESHLRTDAVGDQSLADNKWGYSHGAWQIRTLNNPGKEWWRDKNFITASLENQAKAAYAISGNGTNFKPWSTYNNKDWKGRPQTPPYLQYM